MKIAFISTYPPARCGVATYTQALAVTLQAKSENNVTIFAERLREDSQDSDDIIRSWARQDSRTNAIDELCNKLRDLKPDVIHIQHEFGLFPDFGRFRSLVSRCNAIAKTFVTLHTVTQPPKLVGFFTALPDATYIVHQFGAKAVLKMLLTKHTVYTVPHGATLIDNLKPKEIARKYVNSNLNNEFLYLCPGFMTPNKKPGQIIKAFAKIVENDVLDCKLALVGACVDTAFREYLYKQILEYGLENRIIFNPQYQDNLSLWFDACDVVILGGAKETSYGASGQLHAALGHGKPTVCRRTAIYDEHPVLHFSTTKECANHMLALQNVNLYYEVADTMRQQARKLAWESIADKHLEIYKK